MSSGISQEEAAIKIHMSDNDFIVSNPNTETKNKLGKRNFGKKAIHHREVEKEHKLDADWNKQFSDKDKSEERKNDYENSPELGIKYMVETNFGNETSNKKKIFDNGN